MFLVTFLISKSESRRKECRFLRLLTRRFWGKDSSLGTGYRTPRNYERLSRESREIDSERSGSSVRTITRTSRKSRFLTKRKSASDVSKSQATRGLRVQALPQRK